MSVALPSIWQTELSPGVTQCPLFTWVKNYSIFPFTAVTNYHSLPSLKQHELSLLQLCGSGVWHGVAQFSAQSLTGENQGVTWGFSSHWRLGEESVLSWFWLLAEFSSFSCLPRGPSFIKPAAGVQSFLYFESLIPFSITSQKKLDNDSSDRSGQNDEWKT